MLTAPFPVFAGVHEDTITKREQLRKIAREAVTVRLDANRMYFPKLGGNGSEDDSSSEDSDGGRPAAVEPEVYGARKKSTFALFPRSIVHRLCMRLRKILPPVRCAPLQGEWECEHELGDSGEAPNPVQDEVVTGDSLSQELLDRRLKTGTSAFQCWAEEVRMAFLECMVSLMRNVEHFAAQRKGAETPGPDVSRQAGMPVSAEEEGGAEALGSNEGGSSKHVANDSSSSAAGTKGKAAKSRQRA